MSTSTKHRPPAPGPGLTESPEEDPQQREFVGLEGPYPCSILQASLSSLSPIRKLDMGPYVGFSSNPLLFGHTESTLSEANEKITMHGSMHPPDQRIFDGSAEGVLIAVD